MPSNLLHDLYELGEAMRIALDDEDLDTYVETLEQRGTLLDTIQQYGHPSEIAPDWRETARALAAQHEALMAAVTRQQERMQDSLARLTQLRGAQQSYIGTERRGRILNDDLRV